MGARIARMLGIVAAFALSALMLWFFELLLAAARTWAGRPPQIWVLLGMGLTCAAVCAAPLRSPRVAALVLFCLLCSAVTLAVGEHVTWLARWVLIAVSPLFVLAGMAPEREQPEPRRFQHRPFGPCRYGHKVPLTARLIDAPISFLDEE